MENKGQENKRDMCEKISLILFKDIKAFYKGNYTTITNLEKKTIKIGLATTMILKILIIKEQNFSKE